MLSKLLTQLQESDLQALVTNGRREDALLEYKRELPGGSDAEKKEFLKDISALANADGGDIIYGMEEVDSPPEDKGKARDLSGLPGVDVDQAKQWMHQLVQTCIEPALTGVAIREIPLSHGDNAIVVRVPKSWSGPHVVRIRNHWRFYRRNSAGVYEMSVSELRNAFVLTETLSERLESFRTNRTARLIRQYPALGEGFDWSRSNPPHNRKSVLLIHLQPLDSARLQESVSVGEALHGSQENLFLNFTNNDSTTIRLNFDGLRCSHQKDYTQLFRTGVIEDVDTQVLNTPVYPLPEDLREVEYIDAESLERMLFKIIGRRLALLKSLQITSPVLITISLLGVNGCKLAIRRVRNRGTFYGPSEFAIDISNLELAGLMVTNLQELELDGVCSTYGDPFPMSWDTASGLLRDYCDVIWNAVGVERSPYFDEAGNWTG